MEDDKKDIQTPVVETPTTPAVKKKKNKRAVPEGQVHIKSTFNNTIITFTDPKGGVLSASSAGACGFRGSKKSTAFAAQIAMEKAAGLVKQNYSLAKVDVFVKGLGLGRDSAVRALQTSEIFVNSISDATGLPHGGCRPRKARRM